MKGKKLSLGIPLCLTIVVSVFLVTASASSQNSLGEGDKDYRGSTYRFQIGPGGYWSTDSVLNDDVFGSVTGARDYDVYVMTVTAPCKISINVVDCCMMGDTMFLLHLPSWIHFTAYSPDEIYVSGNIPAGTYYFYVGYVKPHTGVFPAGYTIYFGAS